MTLMMDLKFDLGMTLTLRWFLASTFGPKMTLTLNVNLGMTLTFDLELTFRWPWPWNLTLGWPWTLVDFQVTLTLGWPLNVYGHDFFPGVVQLLNSVFIFLRAVCFVSTDLVHETMFGAHWVMYLPSKGALFQADNTRSGPPLFFLFTCFNITLQHGLKGILL